MLFALADTMQQVAFNPVASAAALISSAERPSRFSRRDGSILRLVPANERLSPAQLEHFLQQLLAQQHMQQLLSEHVPKHMLVSKRKSSPHILHQPPTAKANTNQSEMSLQKCYAYMMIGNTWIGLTPSSLPGARQQHQQKQHHHHHHHHTP
jgi:hypothetical protein